MRRKNEQCIVILQWIQGGGLRVLMNEVAEERSQNPSKLTPNQEVKIEIVNLVFDQEEKNCQASLDLAASQYSPQNLADSHI